MTPRAPLGSPGKGRAVGIALSATGFCVAERRAGAASPTARRIALEPMNGGNGAGWPALTAALRELASAPGNADGSLSVALLPPLAEVRQLDLPPMRDDEMRQLLTRNTSRYFVGVRAPALVGTIASARAGGSESRAVGIAASARLVAAIHASARESGWAVDAILPAEGAWAAAAGVLWPASARRASVLLVTHDDRTDLLQLTDGRLMGLRHFRSGAADASLVAEAIRELMPAPGVARVAAIGLAEPRRELSRSLAASGISLASPLAEWADAADSPDLLAAAFAGADAKPVLVSDEVRASRAERARRATRLVALAAAAVLLLAAAFELWGARRALAVVQDQRAAIRPQIASTLVGRTTVETAFRQLAVLGAAERSAPRWSAVVAGLGAQLSDDAYLTAFRGRGDSVVVDGLAAHAARAFDAMEKTPGLADVRAAAPVRREAPTGGEAMEHFTIAARLDVARARKSP
jgi:hypothetical protein